MQVNMQVNSIILTVDILKKCLFELSDLGGANLVQEASITALDDGNLQIRYEGYYVMCGQYH